MKKVFALLVFVLVSVPVFAANPTAKGNFVVTLPLVGYASASGDLYETAEGDTLTAMMFGLGEYALGAEWFVVDGLAIGGSYSYSTISWGDISITETSLVPMITYYHAMDKIIPFAGIGFSYTATKEESIDFFTAEKITEKGVKTSIIAKVGAAYMLGNNLSAYAEFAYSMDSVTPDGGDKVKGNGMAITAGIKAFF